MRTNQLQSLTFKFVENIPHNVEHKVVYISTKYATAIHKCVCGCGNEVVTPLSPTDWKLIFDGETISLNPSIGNWNFNCRSHYWIKRNKVLWAEDWSKKRVEQGRRQDQNIKNTYYQLQDESTNTTQEEKITQSDNQKVDIKTRSPKSLFWKVVKQFFN